MSDKEALQALFGWFGDRRFQVSQIADDEVIELIYLAEIPLSNTNIGQRSSVGKWLSDNNGLECATEANARLKLVVLEWADDNKPGWYQVQQI